MFETVNYHSDVQDYYFWGNSIVAASADASGDISFLIGPDYTSPNYVQSERLYVISDGCRIDLNLNMKRIRNAGVFMGESGNSEWKLTVFDYAPAGECAIVREVRFEDFTGKNRTLQLCCDVLPYEADGIVRDNALEIVKLCDVYCFGNKETPNHRARRCKIYFENGEISENSGTYCLSQPLKSSVACRLIHLLSYDGEKSNVGGFSLEGELDHWNSWLASGSMPQIENQRYSDVVQSLLLCTKMHQNRDGGFIAGIRKYANSYIRDTHGASRLLLATGHFEEVKRLILNIHTRYEKSGFIPNWWSMGSDIFIGHSYHNDASEITAYYLCMARDYLAHTGDVALVKGAKSSLDFAYSTQLEWLKNHDYTLDFNGDETERYCCNNDGEEYGGFLHPAFEWKNHAFSFASMAAALCSLEWYAGFIGEDLSGDLAALRAKIDRLFLRAQDNTHSWHCEKTKNGYKLHEGQLPNFMLIPLWLDAKLENAGEITDALAVKQMVRADGFIPNCPQIMPGFCGHTMGLFLFAMLKAEQYAQAEKAAETILNSNLLSMYGTVFEFYGPGCVPNGHGSRAFEGGIIGEALIKYFQYCEKKQLNALNTTA